MASTISNPFAAPFPIWKLSRPRPALPNSFFWTWDHSTNWMWDDPGMLDFGCHNHYLKQPETYVEDYRRVTDLAAGPGVRGIIAEALAHWDAGTLSKAQKKDLLVRSQDLRQSVGSRGQDLQRWRFWHWLYRMSIDARERHTVGIF